MRLRTETLTIDQLAMEIADAIATAHGCPPLTTDNRSEDMMDYIVQGGCQAVEDLNFDAEDWRRAARTLASRISEHVIEEETLL